jgi:hypothetical protein
VGRSNWLHVGGDGGLKTAAVLLSVCGSAAHRRLDAPGSRSRRRGRGRAGRALRGLIDGLPLLVRGGSLGVGSGAHRSLKAEPCGPVRNRLIIADQARSWKLRSVGHGQLNPRRTGGPGAHKTMAWVVADGPLSAFPCWTLRQG